MFADDMTCHALTLGVKPCDGDSLAQARECPLTKALLRGIPHGVVLVRRSDGAPFLLLPASARPRCRRVNTYTAKSKYEFCLHCDPLPLHVRCVRGEC